MQSFSTIDTTTKKGDYRNCLSQKYNNTVTADIELAMCVVKTATYGDKLSLMRNEKIFTVPPSIQRDRSRYSTTEGSIVSIPCETFGNPRPEVTWQKEGSQVSLDGQNGYQVTEGGSLTIFNPSEVHSGKYKCTATNPAGSDAIDLELDVYRTLSCRYFSQTIIGLIVDNQSQVIFYSATEIRR